MDNHTQESKPKPDKKIFAYACAILARRRLSVSEFRSKLEKKFPGELESIYQTIELFLTLRYLDDSEYTRLYIQDQLRRKPQGLKFIKQKLRQKGINEATLSSSFNEQIIDEDELIHQAMEKKLRTLKAGSVIQKKQKIYRFLASRGFGHDGIMKAMAVLEHESVEL